MKRNKKNIKLIREPPMVVLIDVLTIFLMMLLLQHEPSVKIELPEHMYSGAKVSKEPTMLRNQKDNNKKYIVVKVEQWKKGYLRIDGALLNEMAVRFFIGCMNDKRLCTQVKLPIDENGKFDVQAYKKLNGISKMHW